MVVDADALVIARFDVSTALTPLAALVDHSLAPVPRPASLALTPVVIDQLDAVLGAHVVTRVTQALVNVALAVRSDVTLVTREHRLH